MNANQKQLRDAAYSALCFDVFLQNSFRLAIKDEELNATPRFSQMVAACDKTAQLLIAMPKGWHYEESELNRALTAVLDFSDALS